MKCLINICLFVTLSPLHLEKKAKSLLEDGSLFGIVWCASSFACSIPTEQDRGCFFFCLHSNEDFYWWKLLWRCSFPPQAASATFSWCCGLFRIILAATSPAVTIPTMLDLIKNGYGSSSLVPTALLASCAIDNMTCIAGYSVSVALIFTTG